MKNKYYQFKDITQLNIKTNALSVVSRKGELLDEVGFSLRNDPQVVLTAIKNDPLSIKFCGKVYMNRHLLRQKLHQQLHEGNDNSIKSKI